MRNKSWMRFEKLISWLTAVAVIVLLGLEAWAQETPPTAGKSQGGRFKGIHIGEAVSALPFPCTPSKTQRCQGPYESARVDVLIMRGKVGPFEVIYFADGKLVSDPAPSLGQAVKIHSLQPGFPQPKFTYARDAEGKTIGVLDVTNRITYEVWNPDSLGPESFVVKASYGDNVASSATAAADAWLSDEDTAELLEAAEKMPPYAPAPVKSSAEVESSAQVESSALAKSVDENEEYKATNREDALDRLKRQHDVVIGKGRRTLSLITQLQIWYELDKDHPDAVAKSEELGRFFPEYAEEYRKEGKVFDVNKRFLWKTTDPTVQKEVLLILRESTEIGGKIASQMRQLKAMGFEF